MDLRDMFCWNNGQTVKGGGGVTFHADLFVVVTWRTAKPYNAGRERGYFNREIKMCTHL